MVRPKHARQADPAERPPEDVGRATRASTAEKPVYEDHSSTYWAPGWNYKRYSEASPKEFADLPEEEMEKMRAGIREALGEHGAGMWARHIYEEKRKKEMSAEELATEQANAPTPDFVKTYQSRVREGQWGFVAMRTACYDDEDKWSKFKARWDKIVQLPFEREEGKPGLKGVEAMFEIRWVEEKAIDGIEIDTLQEKYATLYSTLPGGLQQPVFLNINAEVIDSVLDTEEPTTDSAMWRPDAPFVMAVSKETDLGLDDGHEENAWVKETFKVAIEVLVDQFWDIIASDMMPLRKLTRMLGEDDVWWSNMPSPEHVRKRRRVLQ